MSWNETNRETTDEPTTFSETIETTPGDVYEYRAVADGGEGVVRGETKRVLAANENAFLLALIAEEGAANQTYTFEAEGPVERTTIDDYDAPNDVGAGENDIITPPDGDGSTYHVEGLTGNGFGDAYWVYGPLSSIEMDDSLYAEINYAEYDEEALLEVSEQYFADEPDEPDDGDGGSGVDEEYVEELEQRVSDLEDENATLRDMISDAGEWATHAKESAQEAYDAAEEAERILSAASAEGDQHPDLAGYNFQINVSGDNE